MNDDSWFCNLLWALAWSLVMLFVAWVLIGWDVIR